MDTSKVIAEVARLTAVANEKFPGHVFIVPSVRFARLGRKAGVAHLTQNAISINSDLLKVAPDQIVADTVPHEMAHLIHFALRPQDFLKGSRLGHGRYWQMIARMLGLANPTRCAEWANSDACKRVDLRLRKSKYHLYKCGCGTLVTAGPRHHAKIQRGVRFTIKACGHHLDPAHYIGVKL